MSQLDNTPIMPSSSGKPGPAGWIQVWIKVLTKPSEQTFVEITEGRDATLRTAFIWVFIAGLISGFLQAVLQVISSVIGVSSQMLPGMEKYFPNSAGGSPGGTLLFALCLIPVSAIFSTIGFAIGTAIIQWMAKIFGGTGTFDKTAYAIASFAVPFTLISSLISLLNLIPFAALCTIVVQIGLFIYIIVLEVMAIKAVHRFGWGQAIGSVLIIPGGLLLCSCLVIIALMLSGPMIGNVFSDINQSLQSVP